LDLHHWLVRGYDGSMPRKFDLMGHSRKGISSIELLVVVGLAVVLMGLALFGHGSEKSRAGSEGLSRLIVQKMRAARGQAMAQGTPVALCFPSMERGVPYAQSCYQLEGKARGRVKSVSNLASDFPQGLISFGYWASDTGIDRPGGELASINLESWLPEEFSDYALVFTPTGAVTSNGLPVSDGAYQVLVCSAVDFAAAEAPAGTAATSKVPGYFRFSRVSAPHLIRIEPGGKITLSDSVSGLKVEASSFAWSSEPAPAKTMTSVSPTTPVVDLVEVFPLPPEGETFAVVKRGGSINLKVNASNPGGDDMSLEWKAEPVSGSSTTGGGFSQAGKFPMKWDPKSESWFAEITWTPPREARLGDTFGLSCQVFTAAGFSPVFQPTELREVTVIEDEEIILGGGRNGLFRAHTNGNGLQQIVSGTLYLRHPSASPDGNRLVWTDFVEGRTHLMVSNFDGTGLKTLFVGSSSNTNSFVSPVWNLASTRVYFADSSRIRVAMLDGSPMETVDRDGGSGTLYGLTVSSDQNYMAFIAKARRADGVYSRDLYVGSLDRSVDPAELRDVSNVTADTPKDWMGKNWRSGLCFRPNPSTPTEQTIVSLGDTGAHGSGGTMYSFKVSDTGASGSSRFTATRQTLNWGMPYGKGFTFSRDGSQMALTRTAGSKLEIWDWLEAPTPRLENCQVIDLDELGLSSVGYLCWR
jgi:hypothetical protein